MSNGTSDDRRAFIAGGTALVAGLAATAMAQEKKVAPATAASAVTNVDDAAAYQKVSLVIGKAMDRAWKDILTELASGDVAAVTAAAGMNAGTLSADSIAGFFRQLNGAALAIDFTPRMPGIAGRWFAAHDIMPTGPAARPAGIEGSISIGIGIKF